MARKLGKSTTDQEKREPCAVCGEGDARALAIVELRSGLRVGLCGTHDVMHRRSGEKARSVEELRSAFGEKRGLSRRGRTNTEVDELAERLSAAFTTERRVGDRRAS